MRKISVGNAEIHVVGENEKNLLVEGLPEGSAVWLSVEGESGRFAEDRLSRVYRVTDEFREDVRARFVVDNANAGDHSGLRTVRVNSGNNLLSFALQLNRIHEEKVEGMYFLMPCGDEERASKFASTAAKLVFLTDLAVDGLTRGEKVDFTGIDCARKAVVEYVKNPTDRAYNEVVCSFADIKNFSAPTGGESQMSAVVRRLMAYEGRKPLPEGMVELRSGIILNRVYREFLSAKFGLVAPPDDNLRVDLMGEYLGLDESVAIKKVMPVLPDIELDKIKFRLKCYKSELLATLVFDGMILSNAMIKANRMLPDCGYEADKAIDESDFRLALALAPDFSPETRYTLTGIMKSVGVLDNFL